eukprot:149910-Pelagomonas_calceolata.AAC.1
MPGARQSCCIFKFNGVGQLAGVDFRACSVWWGPAVQDRANAPCILSIRTRENQWGSGGLLALP